MLAASHEVSGRGGHTMPHLLQMVYDVGIRTEFLPPIIFLGVGALTDFRPLLSRPLGLAGIWWTISGTAVARGLAALWITGYREPGVREILGIPSDVPIVALLTRAVPPLVAPLVPFFVMVIVI